jgi:hypothetical protein
LAGAGINRHHDALAAEPQSRIPDQSRVADSRELIDTLSAPALSMVLISSSLRIPPPTAKGIKTSQAVFLTTSTMVCRLRKSADVQEYQFIRTFSIVTGGQFHRIPGVTQIYKIYPLNHPALMHVKTGYNSFGQHRFHSIYRFASRSASPRMIFPS